MRFYLIFIFHTCFAFLTIAQDEPVRGFVALEPFKITVQALCEPEAYEAEWGISGFYIQGVEKERVLAEALNLLKTKTAVLCPTMEFVF